MPVFKRRAVLKIARNLMLLIDLKVGGDKEFEPELRELRRRISKTRERLAEMECEAERATEQQQEEGRLDAARELLQRQGREQTGHRSHRSHEDQSLRARFLYAGPEGLADGCGVEGEGVRMNESGPQRL